MLNRRTAFAVLICAGFLAMSPVTVTVAAEEVLRSGNFTGKSGHKTSGSVSIVKTSAGIEVRLGSNFKLDNAPDPWLGFGRDGKYDSASEVALLKSHNGGQVYRISGPIDVSKFNEFYIWCRKFSVALGVASLK